MFQLVLKSSILDEEFSFLDEEFSFLDVVLTFLDVECSFLDEESTIEVGLQRFCLLQTTFLFTSEDVSAYFKQRLCLLQATFAKG